MKIYKKNTQKNWAENETWRPEKIVFPNSIEEIQNIVAEANLYNKKIKVFGSGHSFSNCAETDGIQVNLKNINNVLSFDRDKQTITVESGIVLRDLYRFFSSHDVALPSIPNTDAITLGGAISNAAHGTNIHHGTISSFVLEMTIVTASGETLVLNPLSTAKYFNAAICSFGSIGIIYSVTLQLCNDYSVEIERSAKSLKNMQGIFSELARRYDSV